MTDPTPTTEALATSEAPQAGSPEPTQAVESDEIKRLRREAAQYRTRNKELEAQEEARVAASLSEQERQAKLAQKYQAELAEANLSLRAERAKLAIGRAAVKLNIDAELAESLALARLEYGDDGQPTNTDAVLKDLLKKWPNLAASPALPTGTPPGPKGIGRGASPPQNDIIEQKRAQMAGRGS